MLRFTLTVNFESYVVLKKMFLDCGRKLERTHTQKQQNRGSAIHENKLKLLVPCIIVGRVILE